MPIYEYRCEECNHEFEAIQKMSDEPLVECPNCLKPSLKKLISAAGFRLKGGGWYETDFKNKNRKNVVDEKKAATGSKAAAGGDKSAKKADKPKVKDAAKKSDKPGKSASK